MAWLTLGAVGIDKVVDQDPLLLPKAMMFPTRPWDDFVPHCEALGAEHVDMANQTLLNSVHSYVLRTGRAKILIDACIGNHKATGVPMFDGRDAPYLDRLAAIGLGPEDIDVVLCTHMHADHVGWNTRLQDGRWVPTFPKARYVFARTELDNLQARASDKNEGLSFLAVYKESVLPVVEAGQAELVATDHELEKGIWLEPAPGHTPGNVIIHLQSQDAHGVFSGDVVHHPVQIPNPDWSPVFCQDPLHSAATRKRVVETLADTDITLLPAHFRGATAGTIRGNGDACAFHFHGTD